MEKYELGLVLGRFQGFHIGHESVIGRALKMCNRVLIFVGSSDQAGTPHNPFDYELRASMVRAVYEEVGERVMVRPLPDIGVGDCAQWGDYLLESAEKMAGRMPDCIVFGAEDKCEKWFPHHPELTCVRLDRNDIPIHATGLRQMLEEGKKEEFMRFTNPKVHPFYEQMRRELLESLYTIVRAGANEKDRVLAFYRSLVGTPYCVWNEEYPAIENIEDDISRDALFLMKNQEGGIVAAISIDQDEDVDALDCWTKEIAPGAELSRLGVSSDYQNRGIACRMLLYGMEQLKERGFRSVHFLVAKDNIKAIRSYAKLSFQVVGECFMYDHEYFCYEKPI